MGSGNKKQADALREQLASKEEWLKHAIALREKAERELATLRDYMRRTER